MIGVAPQAKILNIKVLRSIAATADELKAIGGLPRNELGLCISWNGINRGTIPHGFLIPPPPHDISRATKKTLGPIAAFAGKLNSFDLAANHEKEICPDIRRGSCCFCAIRICLP
jgi:hypothetical protein